MLGIQRLGEAEHDPVAIGWMVDVCGDPALQRVEVLGHRGLLRVRAAGAGRLFAIEQPAPGAGDGDLGIGSCLHGGAGPRGGGHEARDEPVIRLGRLDVGASLQQRQRPAADEVDFEPEQIVVGCRRRAKRLGFRADTEQPGDEPADVRRHLHDEVAARDRGQRFRKFAILRPLRPQLGLGRLDLDGESRVQLPQPRRAVQIGKRKPGKTQWIGRGGLRRHIRPIIAVEHLFK